jgi:hypothetical protein
VDAEMPRGELLYLDFQGFAGLALSDVCGFVLSTVLWSGWENLEIMQKISPTLNSAFLAAAIRRYSYSSLLLTVIGLPRTF